MDQFQNPAKLPLDQVDISVNIDGMIKCIPALSSHWVANRYFLHYEPPKIYHEDGTEIVGAKTCWLEIMNHIVKDLEWLLGLPFYKFWSNIIYDESIIDSVVLFLEDSPTFYNLEKFPEDEEMRKVLNKLSRLVLVLFARIVTNRESPEAYMAPEHHGKLVYDKFLITAPIMMDICQLYGRDNEKIVERIVLSALKAQPYYENDFYETVKFLTDFLNKLENNFGQSIRKNGTTLNEIEDLIVNLLDLSSNAEVFLRVYSPAVKFFSNDLFLTRLVSVYGNTFPTIYKKLHAIGYNGENLIVYTELKHLLDVARLEFLKVFRLITYADIAWILQQPDFKEVDNAKDLIDQFLSHLMLAIEEKDFIRDYDRLHSVIDDVDLVSQITTQIDPEKKEFLLNSITIALQDSPKKPSSKLINQKSSANRTIPQDQVAGPSGYQNVEQLSATANNTSPKNKSESDKIALINEVKSILCDFGEGFIEKCLKHYNYNQEAVINAICEESLPTELKELDKSLPYIPPDSMEKSAEVDKLIGSTRLNVFDGDEFDIMVQDKIDSSKIHRGKRKDRYKNLNDMMNDKSFKSESSNIYQKYSLIQDEWEDEYDDTYDGQDVGLRGADDATEPDARPFTIPRVLRVNDQAEEADEEDEEEHVDQSGHQNGKNFCQDPAVLRAKAEERRQMKRGGYRGDVVGRPKGQGNEKEVLISRDKKNTNKAVRGNHNRRYGADKKRRQGMVPS